MATDTLVREVFPEAFSLSPCRGLTTMYDMPPSYPNPVGLGIGVEMANNTLAREVFRETLSLSPCSRGMTTVYDMLPSYLNPVELGISVPNLVRFPNPVESGVAVANPVRFPNPVGSGMAVSNPVGSAMAVPSPVGLGISVPNLVGLGIAAGVGVGVVAMATNAFLTYPKMDTPCSKKPLLSCFQRQYSKIPMSHSLRKTHTKPISALVKEHDGYGGTNDCTDFTRFGSVTNEKEQKGFSGTRNMTDFHRFGLVTSENKKWSSRMKIQCQAKKSNNHAATPVRSIHRFLAGSCLCIALAIYSYGFQKQPGLCHTTVPYSCLVDGIRDKSVTQVQFVEDSPLVYYNTKPSVDQIAEKSKIDLGRMALMTLSIKWQYQTRIVGDDIFQLIKMLKDQGITYGSEPNRVLLSASMKNAVDYIFNSKSTKKFLEFMIASGPSYIPVLLQMVHNRGRLPKSRKRKEQQPVTFDDVEGVDDAKAVLRRIVACLNKDSNYAKLGAKPPKGVLLTGPPGTGKTLLACALATEAGVSFFDISGSEFVETYVGTGASRVRDLFEKARNSAPSIIFIDEIDAIGGKRGRTSNGEYDNTLNQLLVEMDGFNKDDNVVVIATTNRPDTLDPALLRPGRFTKIVVVNAPDQEGRRKIFALHLKNVPMQEDKEYICDYVASNTEGFVGAGLAEIVAESRLVAGDRGGEFVTFDDILKALATTKLNHPPETMA